MHVHLLIVLYIVYAVDGESSCQHSDTPKSSMCTGCPPMFEGLPCASTTRYNDMTKGACGCGGEPNPPDFWTKAKYTSAGNAMMMGPTDPYQSWCPTNCGRCFELCSTGGTINGEETVPGVCITTMLENRCGDGYGEDYGPYLCGQEMSPWDCIQDPARCQNDKATNMYGYPAHFDLQDATLQVSSGLGWNNVEVTFVEVSCDQGDFGDWETDCYCPRPVLRSLHCLHLSPRPPPLSSTMTPSMAPLQGNLHLSSSSLLGEDTARK